MIRAWDKSYGIIPQIATLNRAYSVFPKNFFSKSFFQNKRSKRSKRSKLMILLSNPCYTFATLLHFNADRARFLLFKKLFPRKNTIGDLQ